MYNVAMKKVYLQILCVIFFMTGCSTITVPPEYQYEEIQTNAFKLASWQKITDISAPYKFYIEGDGYSFNRYGRPTRNPTPRGVTMREIAFGDYSPNVIYLARPCQFVDDDYCEQKFWTTARFSPEVIASSKEVIKRVIQNDKTELILIGYSGGAQVAGLVAVTSPELKVKKLITIAGNLDHHSWTSKKQLTPLADSMDLNDYLGEYTKIPQKHYVAENDVIVPPEITKEFLGDSENMVVVPDATHNKGLEPIYPLIWQEK